MMFGELRKTHRGFFIVDFEDSNGRKCSLQQSSSIGEYEDALERPGSSKVWLGTDTDSLDSRMHLTRQQVQGLVGRLNKWLATGNFEDPSSEVAK